MPIAEYLQLFLPQILLAITAVLALVAEMLHRAKLSLVLTLLGYTAATAAATQLLGTDRSIFMGTYFVNELSLWANILFIPATAASVLLWRQRWKGDEREATGYVLLSFATLGAIMLAGAADLMFLVLGVLLTGIATFALVGFSQSVRSTEAAMKYFVYAAASGAVMLFGLTYWFGATGSTLFTAMPLLADQVPLAIIGLVGVIAGLGYMMAAVPLHQWAPDAYQGTNIPTAAYISIVPKLGAIFGFLQLAAYLPDDLLWRPLVAALAVVSILLGSLAAIAQQNVVRLLAYSSVAQTGFMLLAIVAASTSALSTSSIIVFGAAYAAINLTIFAVVQQQGRTVADFKGGFSAYPLRSTALIIALLSLVGIPPLAGFVGKLLLFGAAIDANYTWAAVVGIIGSVLSLGAYLRIIVPLFQPAVPVRLASSTGQSSISTLIWMCGTALTIGLGLGAQVLFQ